MDMQRRDFLVTEHWRRQRGGGTPALAQATQVAAAGRARGAAACARR
jgi:hypothetical protein